MNQKEVIVISFLVIWIIALIISGSLSLLFKNKYKNFKSQNEFFYKILKKQKEEFKLNKKQIIYELPKNEFCYFYEKNIELLKIKNKNLIEKKLLLNKENKLSLYITNKRIVVKIEDKFFKYKLNQLKDFYYQLTYKQNEWKPYLKLFFEKDYYFFIINDFEILLILEYLKKKEVE